MTGYRPTVALHVVWHPCFNEGPDFGHSLFTRLFEDPEDLANHGLRIPVRLWRTSGGEAPPPIPPVEEADRVAVVVFLDGSLLRGAGWLDYLDRLEASMRDQDLLLAVSFTPRALEVVSPLLNRNVIRLHDVDRELWCSVLLNRVTHALCRLVEGSDAPVRIFLSHAKADGLAIAQTVRTFLQSGTGVGDFFDAQDLLEGSRWAAQMRGAARDNALLAIRTDAYATREWCRTEVLEAKCAGSPVVVLDALEHFEPRGFPYLGNAPSVRWRTSARDALEELLGVALHEVLRFRHFPLRVADLCRAYRLPDDPRVLPAPPELLTVLRARRAAPDPPCPLVYPDPPLGTDELALLAELAPELTLVTPTGLIAAS